MKLPNLDPSGGHLDIYRTLIEYDGPQVFLARNSGKSVFLAMHALPEYETDRWLYVRVSRTRASQIEAGRESLRRAFEDYDYSLPIIVRYINDEIDVDYNPSESELIELYPDVDSYITLHDKVLPNDAQLYVFDEYISELVKNHPAPLWEADPKIIDYFKSIRTTALAASHVARRPVMDIAFSVGKGRTDYPVKKLGAVLSSTQNLFDALCAPLEAHGRGPIPKEYSRAAELVATAGFPSSFGIRIEAENGTLVGPDNLEIAIGKFVSAIQAVKLQNEFDLVLKSFPKRAQRHFKSFTSTVWKGRSTFSIDAGLPSQDEPLKAYLSVNDVNWLYQRLHQNVDDVERVFEIQAKLTGASVKSGFFMLTTEDGAEYSGKMSEQALLHVSEKRINLLHRVILEERAIVNEATGDESFKYTLLDIQEM